jgi:hypothetical protein
LFDELFYVTGNEEDLALRLRVKQTPIAVTSASTISLVKERSFDSVCLWEYLHDLAWLNRKWSGHGDTGLVEFVCPFHRGDVLIALQVAAQATRMGKDIRLHVAESLLGWAQDFSPDFPIEALPVPVPSAEETSSTLLRSYMHLVRRSDVAPRIARSHPRRDLNVTDRNLVAYMLEAIGLPRDTMLINLRPNTQPRHEKEANEVLQSCGESVILLHPLGGWQLKTIPNPMRRDLARIVHQHGFTLIQIGGPDDQKFTECDGWIAADLSPAHWMVIFQKAKALIGVDSWSAHFATIVDIPQITLYGPTNPRHVNSKSFFTDRNHPSLTLGSLVDCSPCNSLKCLRAPVDYCMGYGLSIQAVDRFLRGLRKSGPAFDKNLEQSNTSPNPQWTGSVKRDIRSSSPPLEGVEQLYVSGYRNPLTRYR